MEDIPKVGNSIEKRANRVEKCFKMYHKKLIKIKDIAPSVMENVLISDENIPSLKLKDVNLRRSCIVRLRAKDAKVRESSFIHCVFEDCYFRNAEFFNVNLTDSYFKECNLRKASFQGSCLWYVRFYRCQVDYDGILQSLPSETSIALPLLRSLRQNALEMGEKKVADKILLLEIETDKQELRNQFLAKTDYYRKRFDFLQRIISGFKYLGMILSGLFWGYGLKLRNLFFSALVGILIFAFLIMKFGEFVTDASPYVAVKLNFWKSLYLSIITFTTLGYGDVVPHSMFASIVCAVESFFGFIFLGFLAAAVYRNYSR